jgi:hypothetical protein
MEQKVAGPRLVIFNFITLRDSGQEYPGKSSTQNQSTTQNSGTLREQNLVETP